MIVISSQGKFKEFFWRDVSPGATWLCRDAVWVPLSDWSVRRGAWSREGDVIAWNLFFLQSSLYFCQVLIDEKNKGISRDGTDRDPKRQSRFPL